MDRSATLETYEHAMLYKLNNITLKRVIGKFNLTIDSYAWTPLIRQVDLKYQEGEKNIRKSPRTTNFWFFGPRLDTSILK